MIVDLTKVPRLSPLPEDGPVGLKLARHPLVFALHALLWGLPAVAIGTWWLLHPGVTPLVLTLPALLFVTLLFKIQDEACRFVIVTPASVYEFEASRIGMLDEPDHTERRNINKIDVDDSLWGLGQMLRMADVQFVTASDRLILPKALWSPKVRRQFVAMTAKEPQP